MAPQITGWRYYPEAKGKKPFVTVNSATVEKYALSVSFERMPNHGMERSRASEVLMVP